MNHLDFNQPIDQDRPHVWAQVGLLVHVVGKNKPFLKVNNEDYGAELTTKDTNTQC